MGTSPHPHVAKPPRRSPVKEMKLRRLVDAAVGVCEPENADEKATDHTRSVLRKKFASILWPNQWQRL